MFLDKRRPHAFRERHIVPHEMDKAVEDAIAAAERRMSRHSGLENYAVHAAQDRTRIVTVERWASIDAYRYDRDAAMPGSQLYDWGATGGIVPTPLADKYAGVIIIDIFRIWRPLLHPVSAFTIRNGRAFNQEPGCISTTVFRGITAGAIATYARWESPHAFAAAFSKLTGRHAVDPDSVNHAARRMTMGLIRPDYHVYDLVAVGGAV